MRMIRRDVLTVPAATPLQVDAANIGARSAYIQLRGGNGTGAVQILDNAATFNARITQMWSGNQDLQIGEYLWTPVLNEFFTINNGNNVDITAFVDWYDEPPPKPSGNFTSRIELEAIAAGALFTDQPQWLGRYPYHTLVFQVDRAATIRLDLVESTINIIQNAAVIPIAAATGGVSVQGLPFPAPGYRIRVQNDDGANVNNLTIWDHAFTQL